MHEDLIRNHIGARCLVCSIDNEFLFIGKVIHYDGVNHKVRIEEYNRQPFTRRFELDAEVKAHVEQEADPQRMLLVEGKIEQVLRNSILITPDTVMEKKKERQYFRQNVMYESVISFVNRQAAGHPCLIIDISAGGIALQGKHAYEIGDRLWIYNQRFRPDGPTHNVECVVVRKKALDNLQYFYGCQFVDLDMHEEEKLCSDIFALQATDLHSKRGGK